LGRGVLLEYFLGIVAVEGAFLAAEFLFWLGMMVFNVDVLYMCDEEIYEQSTVTMVLHCGNI
jgi:hypothetical protein